MRPNVIQGEKERERESCLTTLNASKKIFHSGIPLVCKHTDFPSFIPFYSIRNVEWIESMESVFGIDLAAIDRVQKTVPVLWKRTKHYTLVPVDSHWMPIGSVTVARQRFKRIQRGRGASSILTDSSRQRNRWNDAKKFNIPTMERGRSIGVHVS